MDIVKRRDHGNSSEMVRKDGFTLIELLIVIAIISILAAILFPVFARARENARRTSCQSNVKQLAIAALQYVQDNDGRFAPWRYGEADDIPVPGIGNVDPTNLWMASYYPYFKSTQLLYCPSVSSRPSPTSTWGAFYGMPVHRTDNSIAVAVRHNAATRYPTHISSIPEPARTCMIGEVKRNPSNGRGRSFFKAKENGADGDRRPEMTRHLDGANYAYVDGHVKWLKGDAVEAVYQAQGDDGVGITPANASQHPIVFAWKK